MWHVDRSLELRAFFSNNDTKNDQMVSFIIPVFFPVLLIALFPFSSDALDRGCVTVILSFVFLLVLAFPGNPKAMEAAGSAYYDPNKPHSVYMPMVRSPTSPSSWLILYLCLNM